jgi:DNA-directed RNA polymerase specialized sigma24 family protein
MIIPRREQQAFEAFVADASGRLMRTAYLLSGDRGHAEDLAQTALFRTARRWQRARRQPESYAEVAVAADVPVPGDESVVEREHLLAAVRRLPAGQRAVLVLRFFDDLSVAETAAALDCSAGTVKSPTSRALDRLRSVLDQEKENADADR